jgi:hypothetical protein
MTVATHGHVPSHINRFVLKIIFIKIYIYNFLINISISTTKKNEVENKHDT